MNAFDFDLLMNAPAYKKLGRLALRLKDYRIEHHLLCPSFEEDPSIEIVCTCGLSDILLELRQYKIVELTSS